MKTIILLDMDGTIADLYGIDNWLKRLEASDENIFRECKTIISEKTLLGLYPKDRYEIIITTMTPKGATKEYHENVIEQKKDWLKEHYPNSLHKAEKIFLPYGYDKNVIKEKDKRVILIDDNVRVRNNFKGQAIAPYWHEVRY